MAVASRAVLSPVRMSEGCVRCTTDAGNEGLLSTKSKSGGGYALRSGSGNTLMSGDSTSAGSGVHVEPIRVMGSSCCTHLMHPKSARRARIELLTRHIGASVFLIMVCMSAITRLAVILFIFTMELIRRMLWTQWLQGPVTFYGLMCPKPGVKDMLWPSSLIRLFVRSGRAMRRVESASKNWQTSMGWLNLKSAMSFLERPGVTWSDS